MKKLITAIITLGVLFGATWLVSNFMHAKMIEYAFIVSLIVTFIIKFFTSSGGYTSNIVKISVQSQTGIKDESPVHMTGKSFSFKVSLIFTIISLVVTIIYYWTDIWT